MVLKEEKHSICTSERQAQRCLPLESLVRLLVCPECRDTLAYQATANGLDCSRCEVRYRLVEGVPVMMTDGSQRLLTGGMEAVSATGRPQSRRQTWLSRIVRAVTPGGASYDPDQGKRIRAMIQGLGDGAAILDLGSGGRWWGSTVITMDIDRFPNVSLVGDGHRLPFGDDSLDGVICTGVLEHVDDAEVVTGEIWRVVRPGGLVYIGVPFLQGYHPASGTHQDFRRLTQVGLQKLFWRFERLHSGVSGGPSSSLAWILREYLAMLFFDGGRGYSLAYAVAGWLTWWIRYLDCFLALREKAHRIACGFYVLGRKPLASADRAP